MATQFAIPDDWFSAQRPASGADPAMTRQAQDWVRGQAELRARGAGAAPTTAPVAPAAPAAPAAATGKATPKPGVLSRLAAEVPTVRKGLGAIPDALSRVKWVIPSWATGGAAGGVAGAVLTALPEAIGVADVAADPAATKLDVGTRVGEGMFRTGMTGIGAGMGAVAGAGLMSVPLAAAGGYGASKLADFLLSLRGGSSSATPPAAAPAAAPAPRGFQSQVRAVDNAIGPTPVDFGQATTTPSTAGTSAGPGAGIIKVTDPVTGKVTYTDRGTSPGSVGAPVQNRVSTIPVGPGGTFGPGRGADTAGLSAARQAAADRGDWDAVRSSYQQGGGTWQGATAAQDAQSALKADAEAAIRGATTTNQKKNAIDMYNSLLAQEAAQGTAAVTREGNRLTAETKQAELALKGPGAMVDALTAQEKQLRLAAAMRAPDDPTAVSYVGGPAVQSPTFSESLMAQPDPEGKTLPLFQRSGPGAGAALRVPIQSQASIAKGSDNNFYIMGPDGKPIRKASPAEVKRAQGGK